jgi:hypothetical protein
MSKIYVFTQDYENYGSVEEPYWKPKGSTEFFIPNFNGSKVEATTMVMAYASQIECADDFYTSAIVGFDVVSDDYMTEFESSQLKYDGRIVYPAKVLEAV